MPDEGGVELAEEPAPDRFLEKEAGRKDEAGGDRERASERRDDPGVARQRCRRDHARTPGRDGVAPVAASAPLERDERDDDREHEAGDLRRAGEAAAVEPGGVDRDGERPDAEIFARADVVQRLQQRQREPDRERRPRQRQGDGAKHLEAPGAERARDLDHDALWVTNIVRAAA